MERGCGQCAKVSPNSAFALTIGLEDAALFFCGFSVDLKLGGCLGMPLVTVKFPSISAFSFLFFLSSHTFGYGPFRSTFIGTLDLSNA